MAQMRPILDGDGKVIGHIHFEGKSPESCPQTDTGKCDCPAAAPLNGIYGIGSGYGGIGGYDVCWECGKVWNYREDRDD